jgi:hypothetical protein
LLKKSFFFPNLVPKKTISRQKSPKKPIFPLKKTRFSCQKTDFRAKKTHKKREKTAPNTVLERLCPSPRRRFSPISRISSESRRHRRNRQAKIRQNRCFLGQNSAFFDEKCDFWTENAEKMTENGRFWDK